MAPPPTCYLRLSFLLHFSGFGSLVAGYCTPFWTHIKLTTGDVQALGLVVNCYRDGCEMLHITSERTVFIIIFGLCTGTLVLALFSVQAFCLALCNGSCKSRNVGACYSYFSFLVAFCLGATLALYQIDLNQQLRPDVATVQIGWSRWCLVGATGGYLLGAMLNTCDSVKRNRQHREDIQKKAEVKGKMMAEMEARRRQAAAAALRAKAGDTGKKDANSGGGGGGGSSSSSGGGDGAGKNNFKMTAQVAARAAAASIVGARTRGDFKGKRLSIAVDAAVTNALAQLNLQNSLAAGSSHQANNADPTSSNSTVNRQRRLGDDCGSSQRNTDGVILVNEAAANGGRRTPSSDRKNTQNAPKVMSSSRTHQIETKDGGEDIASTRFGRDANERNSRYKEAAPTISTSSLTTTTTSLHNTISSASSAMPSIESLRKSKLTKADHVDSGQDLNRLERLPVVKEERADNPTSSLDDKSRARLEEAQALMRRVSDNKGFNTKYSHSTTHTEVSDNKRDSFQINGTRNDLSLSSANGKTNAGNIITSSIENSTKESDISASQSKSSETAAKNETTANVSKQTGKDASDRNSNTHKEAKITTPNPNTKPDDLNLPVSQVRRKSALGDALLGVSNLISETVSIGDGKSPARSITPKSPSVHRKLRDSSESFSQEMGIDPLPPVTSSKRDKLSKQETKEITNQSHKLASGVSENSEPSLTKTASKSDTEGHHAQIEESKDTSKASNNPSSSNPTCGDGKRVILPRLTSVENTSKPAHPGDSKTSSSSTQKKRNSSVVKVEEINDSNVTNSNSNDANVTSGDLKDYSGDSKSNYDKNATVTAQTPKAKAPVSQTQTLSAQVSEDEMKRKKVVESMVRVSRETRRKRITQ